MQQDGHGSVTGRFRKPPTDQLTFAEDNSRPCPKRVPLRPLQLATYPLQAEPGTIRGDLTVQTQRNVVKALLYVVRGPQAGGTHCTTSTKEALKRNVFPKTTGSGQIQFCFENMLRGYAREPEVIQAGSESEVARLHSFYSP
ncbi:hypothetical protein Tco_0360701 [Tanacetum coccineum]